MKLSQLHILAELVRHSCNVTQTAEALFVAQSAISRHIQLLEEELGSPLFVRKGKRLVEPTPLCRSVLEQIAHITIAEANIRNLAINARQTDAGILRIGTTHTQARFFLPQVVVAFRRQFPQVELLIEQSIPSRLVGMLRDNLVDLSICTEAIGEPADLTSMRCYSWTHALVTTKNHPLTRIRTPLTLQQLAKYDLITYSHQFAGGSHIREAFTRAEVRARIVLAAADSDVIKTYVRLGVGTGIVAAMSIDPGKDSDLVAMPVGHLFGINTTRIAWRTSAVLPAFAEKCKQLMLQYGAALEQRATTQQM